MLRVTANSRPWLIGIDDTDNPETCGTGARARALIEALESNNLAHAVGITRHQLLVDERVPYTSRNTSACIQIRSAEPAASLFEFCRAFMLDEAAKDSAVGLCLATPSQGSAIAAFGRRAKHELLNQQLAEAAAVSAGIRCEGLTGTRNGIIGSLAGIGLFADGNDGRYTWKRKLRDLADQVLSVDDFLDLTGIDDVRVFGGRSIIDEGGARIALGDWPRPVRMEGFSVLLVDKRADGEQAEYRCIEKHSIETFRP